MKALIISFVTHVVVIGAVLIGSVLAPEAMPRLLKRISPPIIASIVVPRDIPLPPVRPARTALSSARPTATAPIVDYVNVAPVVAPSGIAPESGREAFGSPGAVLGVTDGVAGVSDVGTIVAPPPPPPPRANRCRCIRESPRRAKSSTCRPTIRRSRFARGRAGS